MITASQLDRVLLCPASCVLPGVHSTSPAARKGTIKHKYLERAAQIGSDAALLEIEDDEMRELCAAIDTDRLPVGPEYAQEVALAYDVATDKGREVARGVSRETAYVDVYEHEICGTADVIGIAPDHVLVVDYKTGWRDVTPPAQNAQLKFLALAACSAYERDAARVEIVYVREHGGVTRLSADLDALDLDNFALDLSNLRARLAEAWKARDANKLPELCEGEHCEYCPAFTACPAKMRLARYMVSESAATEPELVNVTVDTLRAIIDKVTLAKQIVKRWDSMLYAYAAQHEPIDLGDGRMWGQYTKPGNEKLDGDIAHSIIAGRYSRDVADAACTFATSKTAIRKALKDTLTNGEKLAPKEREIYDAIREAGGATRKVTTSIGFFEKAKALEEHNQ